MTSAKMSNTLLLYGCLLISNVAVSQDADLLTRAQLGDPIVQSELGYNFATGEGLAQHYTEAL